MDTTDNKDLSDKNWNNEKPATDVNEGFSGKNIPQDYNPAKDSRDKETTDDVPDLSAGKDPQQLKTNEDHNYDDASRYPASSPENKKTRSQNL
ncbi:hypothetical protein [Flavobacterium silvaticum]|uniref:Uncharacterized protein n=1 Tax=Flavobacterium silvaticum TaxID=1852020 RepID=A0A972G0D7_9FLAO|nr:hypothetical protein [Flavobacterium silvaticum]NMH28131.1 hypothetical protein [Flavobacterium silvaticum]